MSAGTGASDDRCRCAEGEQSMELRPQLTHKRRERGSWRGQHRHFRKSCGLTETHVLSSLLERIEEDAAKMARRYENRDGGGYRGICFRSGKCFTNILRPIHDVWDFLCWVPQFLVDTKADRRSNWTTDFPGSSACCPESFVLRPFVSNLRSEAI